eukprot:8636375-Ditylum_brightwellii.AAC.1
MEEVYKTDDVDIISLDDLLGKVAPFSSGGDNYVKTMTMRRRKLIMQKIYPTSSSFSIAINITDAKQHDMELMLNCSYVLAVLRHCSERREREM